MIESYQDPKRLRAILLSLGVHCCFLAILLFSALSGTSLNPMKSSPQEPASPATIQKTERMIHAVAINKKDLDKEVARLNQLDQQKKRQQQELQKQALALKKQRQLEELQVKKLKAEQLAERKKAEQQRLQEQQQLEQLKKKKHQEEKELIETQKARAAEESKQKALAEQKALEQKRLADEALQKKLLAEQKLKQQQMHQAQVGAIVDKFGAMVKSKVTQNWLVQGQSESQCVIKVRLAPGGVVLDVEVEQSSGDELLDRSAIAAIYKSSPLPVPSDPEAFDRMRELRLTLKPEDVVS